MNNYEFLTIFYNNYGEFFFIVLLVLIFHYFLFRRIVFSILDPLLYSLIGSCFSTSVFLFLFFTGNITYENFFQFFICQILIFSGLFFFKPLRKDYQFFLTFNKAKKIKNERLFTEIFFVLASMIFLTVQFYVYSQRGIPLLMKSRLETFATGTGFGFLSRLLSISSLISQYLILHMLVNYEKSRIKIFIYFMLCFISFNTILSGSKSAFLGIAFTMFCFSLFNNKQSNNNLRHINFNNFLVRNQKKVIILGVLFAILIIFIQQKGTNPLISLGYRFIDYGSIFWYSYPNQIYQVVDNSHPFTSLFSDFLGSLRIVSWDEQPLNSGLALFRHHHPEYSNIITGPNNRHNIFGLIYFGYFGSFVFSFILGLLVGFVRNVLFWILPANFFCGIVFLLLYTNIVSMETDPMLTFGYLDNILFVLPLIAGISLVLYYILITFSKSE